MKDALIFGNSRTAGEMLSLFLQGHGLTVGLVQSREEILAEIDGAEIDEYVPGLIFLDLILPDCSGFELCRLLKSTPRTNYVSVILCCSEETNTNQFGQMENGPDAYLPKPFTQAEVDMLLEQWREGKFKNNNHQNLQNGINDVDDVDDINKDINVVNASLLEEQLQNFVSSNSDVEGAALVSPDGLPITSALPNYMDEEQTAAISAVMLSMGERIGSELSRGTIEQILIEGEKGYGILLSCNEDALLLVFAKKEAKQGLLFLAIKRLVSQLTPLLT